MNARRYLDINSRLAGWFLARRVSQTTDIAERLFREYCADPVLEEYMISLPLGRLPEIRLALSMRARRQGGAVLEDVIRAVVTRDWRRLSPAQIDHAVDVYVCSIGRALLPEHLASQTPGTSMRLHGRVFL